MATPLPDKLGLYYASKDLTNDGAVATSRIVGVDSTPAQVAVTNISEESGYWNGAMGFFTTGAAANLQTCFHVRKWDKENNILTLAQPLPSAPVSGNQFKMFLGGKYRSSTKLLGLKVGGVQPEFATVATGTITGVTIKYISPYLGTGTLTLLYVFKTTTGSTRQLSIRMGSNTYGEAVLPTANGDYVIWANDGSGFIIVNIVYASLPAANATDKSQTFTLSQPKGSFVPSFEGYETNTGKVYDRYHLLVARNDSASTADVMSALSVWLDKPAGINTTLSAVLSSTGTTATIVAATNWPSRGFWITNGSQFRYVLYRSDLTLYLAVPSCVRIHFNAGIEEIRVGNTITFGAISALVDDVVVTGGSWAGLDATGYLMVQGTSSLPGNGVILYVNETQVATATAAVIDGESPNLYSRRQPCTNWSSGSVVYPAPDIDIGIEAPNENEMFQNPADERTAPEGVKFSGQYIDQNTALIHDGIQAAKCVGIWVREHILDSMQTRADVDGDINFAWY
ncbi:MAG: hypothetical protein LBQ66_13025 [Planctomycetaceae bacterium]|jgi:hypothetical protein|nr:hypothetical protein [Planctomycetaceae bacterium]